ncbi:tetratricopeptide repeat protein [Arenimonas daejeonensis]|uniref:tetratricopeptide repeat protein n=1 Tax=Arenimonas daejeonensis TaxID=370777 RepID=UPI0011BF20C8|nr:tetratricopeptide repeat protein [Arenimonas daejeonensis]
MDAEHPQVLLAEGYVAQVGGDAERAIKAFTAAAQANPELAGAQHALGMAYVGRGLWPFAEQAFNNALALEPENPGALRALAETCRHQGKHDEAMVALDRLLALHPDDIFARAMRAHLRQAQGKDDEALADMLSLLDAQPTVARVLESALPLLVQRRRNDEALARIEAALSLAPGKDRLWTARLWLSGVRQEEPLALLQRWNAAVPDSAACLEYLAEYHEVTGNTAQAAAFADQALARDPNRFGSRLVKLRIGFTADPEATLAQARAMAPLARTPKEQRLAYVWQGLALDQMGRHPAAAACWREMVRGIVSAFPLPQPQPADAAPAGDTGGGALLWSPAGLRLDSLLPVLQRQLGARLQLDRIGQMVRGDGFGLARRAAGHPEAGDANKWRAALEKRGLDPATVVDWIPQIDGYTLAALRGARLVAVVADPRDVFLSWMVQGSTQDYIFPAATDRSAEWLAQGLEALAAHRDAAPDQVTLVHMDRDAGAAGAALEQALGLAQPLSAVSTGTLRFSPGHWRKYRESFAAEFARLAPVAERLGYSAD